MYGEKTSYNNNDMPIDLPIIILQLIALIIISMIGSFSPLLYLTHLALLDSQSPRRRTQSNALIGGIVSAGIVILIGVTTTRPEVIHLVVTDVLRALVAHRIIIATVGVLLLIGGIVSFVRKPPVGRTPRGFTHWPPTALFMFGFLRTLTSATAIGMLFVAGNIIDISPNTLLVTVILSLLIVVSFISSHLALRSVYQQKPEYTRAAFAKLQRINPLKVPVYRSSLIVAAGTLLLLRAFLY